MIRHEGYAPDIVRDRLREELAEAERKAWDALGRYKFQMFGYWAGVWVHLNRISGDRRPNPWKLLVLTSRVRRKLLVRVEAP